MRLESYFLVSLRPENSSSFEMAYTLSDIEFPTGSWARRFLLLAVAVDSAWLLISSLLTEAISAIAALAD